MPEVPVVPGSTKLTDPVAGGTAAAAVRNPIRLTDSVARVFAADGALVVLREDGRTVNLSSAEISLRGK